jgi:hypothetical protein
MVLTFTSLGVKEDKLVNRRGGWVFQIQGELSHLISSLHPDDSKAPFYAQLYIYDTHLTLAQRVNRNDNLDEGTMKSLQSMLLKYHRYSREFKHMYKVLKDHSDISGAQVRLSIMPSQDQR